MTQTTRVEISCINIKLKKTDLVGERTATKYIQISYNNYNSSNSLFSSWWYYRLKRIEILHRLQSQPISSEAFQPEFPVFPRKSYVPLVYYFTETVTLGATFIGSLTI